MPSTASVATARKATKRTATRETTERMTATALEQTATPMAICARETATAGMRAERPADALGRLMIHSAASSKAVRIAGYPATSEIETAVEGWHIGSLLFSVELKNSYLTFLSIIIQRLKNNSVRSNK